MSTTDKDWMKGPEFANIIEKLSQDGTQEYPEPFLPIGADPFLSESIDSEMGETVSDDWVNALLAGVNNSGTSTALDINAFNVKTNDKREPCSVATPEASLVADSPDMGGYHRHDHTRHVSTILERLDAIEESNSIMMNRILRQIDAAGEASKRTTAKIFEKIEQEGEGVERMTRTILERLDEVERASRIVGRKGQERMNTLDGTAAGAAIRKLANGFQRFSQDVMAHLEEARQWRERVGEE